MRQSSFTSYQAPQDPALPEYKRMDQQARHDYSHVHTDLPQKLQLSGRMPSGTKEEMKKNKHFQVKNKSQMIQEHIMMYSDGEDQMEQDEQNRQMLLQQQKKEERKKHATKLEGSQQRGRLQPTASHK